MAFATGFVYGVLGLVVFHFFYKQNTFGRSLIAASSTCDYLGRRGTVDPTLTGA
jgi:hypothetical protein